MDQEYLNKVWTFLKQEMPKHGNDLRLDDGVFVFRMPEGQSFQSYYEEIHEAVKAHIERIRRRETDLSFKVWSPYQERDFKILKP
ncbi:hypothetical protein D0C36_22775 [Mucilaginibacter conchicola]|uniref:Uncharacterized protein n=1 Tax=Mucilaginibacter conchicola TaxID=2303333 RepID=A0A372NM89_9SPHI|nr:hypothetical protein [Mucilaginibacter conchicola]RFZ90069.1 hypothetical protein D0C36_22775 [Mucilaginibacter conchicola]